MQWNDKTRPAWQVLIVSLPTQHSTERMRVWRALKALGCGVLRDGVYLLPAQQARIVFARQAADVMAAGGQAYVLELEAASEQQEDDFRALFDRDADYAALKIEIEALRAKLKRPKSTLAREAAQLQKNFAGVAAMDYFPGAAREQLELLLDEVLQQVNAQLNPDEPQAIAGKIKRLERSDYQGRTWATRKRLWVDRMASAWLIARFIDHQASFKWLAKPADCPKRALGFDFDGATFTHVGSRVTYEVLMANFGLEEDPALARIGGLVHCLDVGGVPVAEAAGLEAVLKGLREQAANDDVLLAAAAMVFDGLYAGFLKTDYP